MRNFTSISKFLPLCLGLTALAAGPVGAMPLPQAVALAQAQDPWIEGSMHQQRALASQKIAAGTLPDPQVNAGFANLPTDTFDFDQEAMTQFKVGVSQAIPRGDSRSLRQQQLGSLEAQHPLQRADRRALLATNVAVTWLEAWRAQESIRLIEEDRDLFEQLVDVAQSNYASALGQTRQQDLIRAQLELTRLDDRLVQLNTTLDMSLAQLSAWLQGDPGQARVSGPLPSLSRPDQQWLSANRQQEIASRLSQHPAILAVDRELDARSTGISIAEQQYKPEWRLNASYGYRDDDPTGPERADFFSVGVSFDLPIFTSKRQDQQRQSATAETEATRTRRALMLRKMVADFQAQTTRLMRLEQRASLYDSRLLREMQDQAEASLSAYTNDDGDFAEVVRAKIAELNARIDALGINVDRQITIARINYFFASASSNEDTVL